jgi:hypothetical protein
METEFLDIVAVTCRNLRNKKMSYLPLEMALRQDDFASSEHCWCDRTGTGRGPDGGRVAILLCRTSAGRECFQSIEE